MNRMTRSQTHFGPFVSCRFSKSIKATTSKMSCKMSSGNKISSKFESLVMSNYVPPSQMHSLFHSTHKTYLL